MRAPVRQGCDCDLALLLHLQAMGQRLHNLGLHCDASGLLPLFLEFVSSTGLHAQGNIVSSLGTEGLSSACVRGVALVRLSNRLARQALCIVESHIEPCLAMSLSIVSSLRMQVTWATFLRLPPTRRRS